MQTLSKWYDNGQLLSYNKVYTFIERLNQERLNLIECYNELINLYNEAEIKRARIQELERLLSANS